MRDPFFDKGLNCGEIVLDAGDAFFALEEITHPRWKWRADACGRFDRIWEFCGVCRG
jgi:hypothetical protein